MSKLRVHKPTFSNYAVAKKSSPLIQTRPLINPLQQVNAENAQKPVKTINTQTAEEWKKDNVFLKAIETLEAQQQQAIQAKLTVGEPGDKYEQEADAMASKVMSISDATVQKQSEEKVQTKPLPLVRNITPVVQRVATRTRGSVQANGNLESRLNSSKGGGSPLPNQVRSFMEPRFGADFSRVRVHTDTTAVQMNRELGAQAFTHGSDIYYGEGKAPGNNELTAHELTHVVQQTGAHNIQRQEQSTPQQEDESNHEAMLDEAIGIIQNALNILANQTQGEGHTSANPIPDAEQKKQDLQKGLTELQALKGSGKKEEIISVTQPIIAAAKGDMTQAAIGEQPSQKESGSDSVPAIQRRVTVQIPVPQERPPIEIPAPAPQEEPPIEIPAPVPQEGLPERRRRPPERRRRPPRMPRGGNWVSIVLQILMILYENYSSPENTDPNSQKNTKPNTQTDEERRRRSLPTYRNDGSTHDSPWPWIRDGVLQEDGTISYPGRVELRYKPVFNSPLHHGFVVVTSPFETDTSGKLMSNFYETHYRGGPSNDNNPFDWGFIKTLSFPYVKGQRDWTLNPAGRIEVTTGLTSEQCTDYRTQFQTTMEAIQSARIAYGLPSLRGGCGGKANSNSTAHQAIRDAGLGNPVPPVSAPCWEVNPFEAQRYQQ
ncbi:MAG TPA: DUF4157 domain-containing protein [Nostocaceae cyanobacterium]|nr:DUF4157 domain-containing protein [Nostocaceae cyanobacterium]